MDKILIRQTNTFFTSQEIHHILWTPKIHYPAHKHQLSVPNLSQLNPIKFHPISLSSILVLHSHLRLGLPNVHFPSNLLTQILHVHLLSCIRAA